MEGSAAKSTGSGRWHVCRRRFRPRQRPARQGACDACIAHLRTARQRPLKTGRRPLPGAKDRWRKYGRVCCTRPLTKSSDDVPGGRLRRGLADVTVQLAGMLDLVVAGTAEPALTFYLLWLSMSSSRCAMPIRLQGK
ncbi:hypothetical protein BDA96_04G236300 [Sorghum bicolor]|jgi:hypothetical protein|uniref:Uncharacterized protein n=1 Tax=Sorghum bicolor TaxID=4558 RepID=A0A921R746_SORBI|nr:hypothetical protein BDA96_04G236300 [Sorghum bicolor]